MSKAKLVQVWDRQACVPKSDVLEGKYLKAELALDLHAITEGTAKAPYNDPVSFFEATHMSDTLKRLLKDTLSHLAGKKAINPVLVFDVGFGGGKTHAMAAIFYAAKYGGKAAVANVLGSIPIPVKCRTVTVDGSAYSAGGVKRGRYQFKTLWADFLYQLGEIDLAKESDAPEKLPDRQTITSALSKEPTLILVDEVPKYLDLIKDYPELLTKVKHFIHTLTLSVCEVENSILIVSVAGDAYRDAADAVRVELTEAMSILSRKMQSVEPVRSEDVPFILKRRLFDFIDPKVAESTAKIFVQLYGAIRAPEKYRRADYERRIADTYPFHPELIDVLYERLSTLPKFQRTRGALRLLAHVIQKTWKDKEGDAYIIQPYHVDLSSPEILEELTARIGEDKYRNAVTSDVFALGGKKAKAQQKDIDYQSHFGAPLFRRACNAIYLYSLTGAKEEAKGIDLDELLTVLATPAKEEQIQYYRDQVLPAISQGFWYVDLIGTRFIFRSEPGENRIIDQESQNVPNPRAAQTVKKSLQDFFKTTGKGHFFVTIFPDDPSAVTDDMSLKISVLNPLLSLAIASESHVPEKVAQYILHRDSKGNLRTYRNNVFLLVAREGAWETLRDGAARLEVSRNLAEDPEKYGIPHERKKKLQQKVAEYETRINETVRASFTYIVYAAREGKIEAKSIKPSGYGTAQPGQDLLWHLLSDVLNRVRDEPLDPDYAKMEAWPVQAQETTTRALYENIHKKPGTVLPENESLFEKTILEGVKKGSWVLVQQNKTYAPENVPTRVIISSDAQLLTPDEAAKRNLTNERGHLCEKCHAWPCRCGEGAAPPIIIGGGASPPVSEFEVFEPTTPKAQLEDLERWIRSKGIEDLSEATLRVLGTTEAATKFRNLVRLGPSGRKMSVKRVSVKARVFQANLSLDCTFETDEKGLETPAAKLLDDVGRWSLPEFEGTITLQAEKIPVNDISDLIKSTLKTEDVNMKLGLQLKPKQVK